MSVATDKAKIETPRDKHRTLITDVAAQFGCTFDDVMGGSRHRGGQPTLDKPPHKKIVQARWAAMRRLRDEFKYSTPTIGRIFGRDHTSVQYALGMLGHKKRSPYHPTKPPEVFHEVSLVENARESIEVANP